MLRSTLTRSLFLCRFSTNQFSYLGGAQTLTNKSKGCSGCGVLMQSTDPAGLGFVRLPKDGPPKGYSPTRTVPISSLTDSSSALKESESNILSPADVRKAIESASRKNADSRICVRCHDMRHQSRLTSFAKTRDSERLWETLVKGPKCAFGIVFDVSDPASAFFLRQAIEPVLRSGNPFLWIGTKRDIIPDFLGLNTPPQLVRPILDARSVTWVSTGGGGLHGPKLKKKEPKSSGLDNLLEKLRDISFCGNGAPRLPTYLIGLANAGKSQLLNALIERTTGRANDAPLTVFPYPGTTLGLVSHRLPVEGMRDKNGEGKKDDALTLIDTPGATHPGQLTHLLTPKECVRFLPNRPIIRECFVLRPGQSLLLGGLVRVDALPLESGESDTKTALIVALGLSNEISRHVTKTADADTLLSRHAADSKLLVPPLPGNDALPPMLPAIEDFTLTNVPPVLKTRKTRNPQIEVGLMGIGILYVSSRFTVTARINTRGGKGVALLSPLKLSEIPHKTISKEKAD